MRILSLFGFAVLGSLLMAANLIAQPAPRGAGGGRGAGRAGAPAGGAFAATQDAFQRTIIALGELNLRPDFNLSDQQKQKLQAIRDDVKKLEDQWRTDHAADLKKIQDDTAAARQAGDQQKMRELMTARRDLMQTMPKTDEAAQKVKGLLTPDQAKALETRITERQDEMRNRMGAMTGGRGAARATGAARGGRGARGGAGGRGGRGGRAGGGGQ